MMEQPEQGIPDTEEEILEEVKGLSSDRIEHMRRRALNQVYFMAKAILGHKDVNKETHGDLGKFLDSTDRSDPNFRDRRMALMPRGGLKTTVCTETDSLRIGLRDPDQARVLIANEVVGNATAMLSAIMGYCEKNELLRLLFSDRIPTRFTGPGVKWSSTEGAILVRKTSWKEPTWLPIGVGGAAVSKHFSHIKCDDLIGLEAYNSEAEMKRATNWVDHIEGLIISDFDTIIDWIGTRWRRRDLYNHVMRIYGDDMRVFRRRMFEELADGTRVLFFPQHYTWKKVNQLMKKPAIFAAQYMNDPASDELQDFSETNLRFFEFTNNGSVLVGGERWPREALDVSILVDPNSGSKTAPDEAAITTTGVTPKDDVLVLSSWGGRPDPDGLVDTLFETVKRWRPRVIGIEKAGQQNTIHYFKKKMQRERLYFNVVEVHHKNQEKNTRIRTALSTLVSEHRLYLLRSQLVLKQQLTDFPDLENDDRIDSLAYGPQLWRKGLRQEDFEENDRAVAKLMKSRSKRTGY